MKKILIVLLTFTIGILAFDLLTIKQLTTTTNSTAKQKTVEKSELIVRTHPVAKTENFKAKEKPVVLKPFFDSFDKEEFDKNDYQY